MLERIVLGAVVVFAVVAIAVQFVPYGHIFKSQLESQIIAMSTFFTRLSFFFVLVTLAFASSACAGAPAPTLAVTPQPILPTPSPVAAAATQPPVATIAAATVVSGTVPSQSAVITPTVVITATLFVPTSTTALVLQEAQNPQLGKLLTDAQGMTLYTYKSDAPDVSNCTGDCATLWPPLTVPFNVTPAAAPGITGYIGVLEREGNQYQVTFNDAPLYRYSKDTKPGDTNGNGLDGKWSVVRTATAATPTTVSPATPTSTGK